MFKEIKIVLIILCLYSFLFHKSIKILELNNQISQYEYNIDYSNYTTDIKAIVLYYPSFNWNIMKKKKQIFKEYEQMKISEDNNNHVYNYNFINVNKIKKQIQLAKSHGIYGLAINYNGISGKNKLDEKIDFFLNDNEINFPFFLILEDEKYEKLIEKINFQELKEEYFENCIKKIQKYLKSPRYITINKKPILGINVLSEISTLEKAIFIFQKCSIKYGLDQLIILGFLNGIAYTKKIEDFPKLTSFKLVLMIPPIKYNNEDKVKGQNYSFYNYLLYKNIELNNITTKNEYYRCSIIEYNYFSNKSSPIIFNYYSPEIFYIFNKVIVDYTKKSFNNSNRFIFINVWNNLNKESFLEPDEQYGYASLNSLSKSIFNLPYKNMNSFEMLNKQCIIAVQAHIYYEELIDEIVEKTNNIPVKFDLFISTDSKFKKEFIEKHIKYNTNSINHSITIYKNKGRDVLPFIIQLKGVIKNYKYICHIHTKHSLHSEFGEEWRSYLFTNLLGSNQIVSEIISDFEMSENLGIIFPEIFYKILLKYGNKINRLNLFHMNYLIRKIAPNYKIIDTISDFPAGNMFWARTIAVHQIFEKNIWRRFPKEKGQIDSTIMHAIERIWPYLVKLNGLYYKKIFKHF